MFELIRQFLYIWKEVMFHPARFFKQIQDKEPIGKSFVYSLVVKLLVIAVLIVANWIWESYHQSSSQVKEASFLSLLKPGVVPLFIGLAVFAVFDIIGRFLYSGLVHVLLLIFRSGQKGFASTFRVVSYSESSYMFFMTYIGIIWWLIIMVIGLKQSCQTPVWKSIIVSILSLVIYYFVIAISINYLFIAILLNTPIGVGGGHGGGRIK